MYSRSHESLDPDDPHMKKEFWDFSIDETGPNDLGNIIDYIR